MNVVVQGAWEIARRAAGRAIDMTAMWTYLVLLWARRRRQAVFYDRVCGILMRAAARDLENRGNIETVHCQISMRCIFVNAVQVASTPMTTINGYGKPTITFGDFLVSFVTSILGGWLNGIIGSLHVYAVAGLWTRTKFNPDFDALVGEEDLGYGAIE